MKPTQKVTQIFFYLFSHVRKLKNRNGEETRITSTEKMSIHQYIKQFTRNVRISCLKYLKPDYKKILRRQF